MKSLREYLTDIISWINRFVKSHERESSNCTNAIYSKRVLTPLCRQVKLFIQVCIQMMPTHTLVCLRFEFQVDHSKTVTENQDSKQPPSVGAILAYLETTAYIIFFFGREKCFSETFSICLKNNFVITKFQLIQQIQTIFVSVF